MSNLSIIMGKQVDRISKVGHFHDYDRMKPQFKVNGKALNASPYEVHTPSGNMIHVLVNHFKSQSGGGGPKRKRQAKAVRDIAQKLIAAGRHVVVLGDLNEGPKAGKTQAENLTALYGGNAPLVDIWTLPQFDDGGRPGSYDACGLSNRLDYIFLSPSLVGKVNKAGVSRKGLWGGRKTKPDKWATYPEMLEAAHQASDHSCLWVEVKLD